MLEATFETTELHCDHLKGELTEINRQRGIIVCVACDFKLLKAGFYIQTCSLMLFLFYYRQEINTLRQQLDSNERKLRTFESSRSNYQKRFGEWVPDALMKIDAAFRRGVFSQKPRGPLGSNIFGPSRHCFPKLSSIKCE